MRAMVLKRPGEPLLLADIPRPEPGPGEILLRVRACGVCRTDRHTGDGQLASPTPPLVPGHPIGRRTQARRRGVEWVGPSDERAPQELDAAIIFAPVGELVPGALRAVAKGGVVVCGGIHMSDIPSFPYELLWGERVLRSVANLTRRDGEEFLALAPRVPVHTAVEPFPLKAANEALARLRGGKVRGAAVLVVGEEPSAGEGGA